MNFRDRTARQIAGSLLKIYNRLANLEIHMSVVDDAIANMAKVVADHHTAVMAEVDALKAAIAASDPVAAQASADKINALATALAADTAAMAPPVVPAPAPAPSATPGA